MSDREIFKRDYSEQKTKKAYSRVSYIYNLWSRLFESKTAARVIEIAQFKNGDSILEAAVGTGVQFEKITLVNKNGFTEGIDLSPDMLSFAKKRIENYPKDNYRLQTGSVYDLPYENGKFDLIINSYMFDLLPEEDYPKILGEFSRVLKKGGRVVISTMTFGKNWYNKPWDKIAEWFPSLMTDCRPIHLGKYIEDAGFEIKTTEQLSQNSFPSEIIKAVK
jgi:ubiquinone/menaquinone biosynthesis C-methylase UbiE